MYDGFKWSEFVIFIKMRKFGFYRGLEFRFSF